MKTLLNNSPFELSVVSHLSEKFLLRNQASLQLKGLSKVSDIVCYPQVLLSAEHMVLPRKTFSIDMDYFLKILTVEISTSAQNRFSFEGLLNVYR